jgi:hypothetical protein
MSFLESDYDNVWSALRGNQGPIALDDHDLLIGASRSVDAVSELTVFPPDPDDPNGGGWSDPGYQDPRDEDNNGGGGDDSTLSGFQAMSQALEFAQSKLGDVSGEVASHLTAVLKLLYFAAHAYEWTVDGPLGSKLSNLELAGALEKMNFYKGPHPFDPNAVGITNWRQDGSGKVDIYLSADNEKYSEYTNRSINGFFYVILHELGHAMPDTWDMMFARTKDGSWSEEDKTWLEKLANEYGRVLGRLVGLPYPD